MKYFRCEYPITEAVASIHPCIKTNLSIIDLLIHLEWHSMRSGYTISNTLLEQITFLIVLLVYLGLSAVITLVPDPGKVQSL